MIPSFSSVFGGWVRIPAQVRVKPHVPGGRLTGGQSKITKEQPNPFFITPRAGGDSEAVFFEGYDKVGAILAKNADGNKYYKKITAAEEAGFRSGSKFYGYAFTRSTDVVFVRYTALPGKADQHDVVEKLVRTLELK